MIKEAIDKIQQLAATSKGLHVLKEFENRTFYAIPTPSGGWSVDKIDRDPEWPTYALGNVDDAIAFAAKAASPEDAVWIIGDKSVGVLFSRGDLHSGKISVRFGESEAWGYLRAVPWKAHADFVAFVRRSMPFLPATFTGMVRNLKIEKSESTDSEATPTSAAMGKRFSVKASGAGDLPDSVSLSFKPFFNVDFGATVQCVFEIDFNRGLVRLVPIDGEIDGNLERMHDQIAAEINAADPAWLVVRGSAS